MNGTIIYFSHGGGPLPILGDKSHEAMISFMKSLPEAILKPEAIIVVSAHWEMNIPTIICGNETPLLYDYYGFPKEAYELEYPACGSPETGQELQVLFETHGIESQIVNNRGFDHGVFIPLKMMYPNADIPIVQVSLVKGLDPHVHIQTGRALKSILDKNVLLIGSGFSYHNLQAFDWAGMNTTDERNDLFQNRLIDICSGEYTQKEREEKLTGWERIPNARYCHPREEHLLPLHVCFGASETEGEIVFDDYILGKRSIAVKW